MRCYLEVPIHEEEESRQDLCPTFCPALAPEGWGKSEEDAIKFYCNAGKTPAMPLKKKLDHVLITPADGNPGWFEVKRHEKCPIKTSATPVW